MSGEFVDLLDGEHIAQSQDQKEATANAAFDRLTTAHNLALEVDCSDGDVTIDADDFGHYGIFKLTGDPGGSPALISLSVPGTARKFAVINTTATPVTLDNGTSVTASLSAAESAHFVSIATDGLYKISPVGSGVGDMLGSNNLSDVDDPDASLDNLGATDAGKALLTIADPSAIRYVRINADNSVTALTLPQLQADLQDTGLDADAAGFRGVPPNSQTGSYTCVAADAGKHIVHPSGGGAGDTFTIPANASVAYEIGTALTFVNMDSNSVAIAITSDTMRLAGAGTTGSRTLAQYGIATALKVDSTTWLISGTGLT